MRRYAKPFKRATRRLITSSRTKPVELLSVTAGRPVAFVANLDHGPSDLHCLVAGGLIYSFDDKGQTVNWNPDAMLQFYRGPEWQLRLKVFANIDEDQEEVREGVVTILRELAMETRKTC